MHFPYGALESVTVLRRLRNHHCIIIIIIIIIIITILDKCVCLSVCQCLEHVEAVGLTWSPHTLLVRQTGCTMIHRNSTQHGGWARLGVQ